MPDPCRWPFHIGMPELPFSKALAALADAPHLIALQDGPHGWCHLAWGEAPVPLHRLADLPLLDGALPLAPHGWPAVGPGLAAIQLDYRFPVGGWAQPLPADGQPPGRWWPLSGLVSWDPGGQCHLQASTRPGLDRLRHDLTRPAPAIPPLHCITAPQPAWDAAGHAQRVTRIRRLIAAGDLYQANLTVPFQGRLAETRTADLALFLWLQQNAPGSFAALFRSPDRSVLSHSPECFLACDGRQVVSRPIKGTRPTGKAGEGRRLSNSIKNQAELTMIVDLVRNDLGRVASPGSVVVQAPDRLDLTYVHHLVATVQAQLRPGCRLAELLAATFPAGSITGAPKIRAMQVLSELESGDRGPYCGTYGLIGAGAAACLAVAIRTLVVIQGRVQCHAGGGIVWDSRANDEWQELLTKAGPMLRACQLA